MIDQHVLARQHDRTPDAVVGITSLKVSPRMRHAPDLDGLRLRRKHFVIGGGCIRLQIATVTAVASSTAHLSVA
jgi:hypothetical protein